MLSRRVHLMHAKLIWLRVHTFLLVICCPLLGEQQPASPTPQTNLPAAEQPNSSPVPSPPKAAVPPPAKAPAQPGLLKVPQTPAEQAWQILENACASDKTVNRATAVLVLGLIPNNSRSARLAAKALTDDKPEVRTAAAAALGEMKSRASIPKLKVAIGDPDPSVALAAAHSLDLMHDSAAFEVYYEILNGERKARKGLIASQSSLLHDPKKMATLGLQEGMSFVPFGGLGWGAIKVMTKDDISPVRAAAARELAKDPDPATTKALTDAVGDKSWIVQAAALEALAKRGDPSVLNTVEKYTSDEKDAVKYTAAATVLRLTAIRDGKRRKQQGMLDHK